MTVMALFQSHCFLEMLELNHCFILMMLMSRELINLILKMNVIAFALNHDTVFEFVEPGTYVCMRSPTNDIESFFCC